MIAFISLASAMTALALVLVLPPLLRDASGDAAPTAAPASSARRPAWLIGLALPLLAAALYAALGHPQALTPAPEAIAAQVGVGPAQVERMVAGLAARLKARPDDPDGWRMLARSYESLGRFEPAADAYRHLLAHEPDNPDLLVDYAVVLGMTLDHKLAGAPLAQIEHALAVAPNHIQALALLGSAAMERGDLARALQAWRKILTLVPADSDVGRAIAASIDGAQEQAPQAR